MKLASTSTPLQSPTSKPSPLGAPIPSAIAATRRAFQELVDGTLRVKIDIEPNDVPAFMAMFPVPGAPMAVTALKCAAQPLPTWGEYAEKLKLSGFCRAPEVWKAVGTDIQFLAWVSKQPCAVQGGCQGEIVAAHVRRISSGAGMALKPSYAAIPLCDFHHKLQHQQGESVLFPKEIWDKLRIDYVEAWAWLTLKTSLGYESMRNVPPAKLLAWAQMYGVEQLLPSMYREGI